MSIDERATLTNMVAELGGYTGIVAPDDETRRFLRERRGVDFTIEPWMASDPGAAYADTIVLDGRQLSPMVAAPGDPGNGRPLCSLAERPRIDIAYGGSCTAGKREDFDHYHAVLRWAADRGLRVAEGVKLYLQFGTVDVRDHCIAQGYLAAFASRRGRAPAARLRRLRQLRAGRIVVPAASDRERDQPQFPRPVGAGSVWLASPPTVAASAIAGELASFDELQRRFADRRIAAA